MLFLIIIAVGLLHGIISELNILGPHTAGSCLFPLPLGLWLEDGSVNDDGGTHFSHLALILEASPFLRSIPHSEKGEKRALEFCLGVYSALDFCPEDLVHN